MAAGVSAGRGWQQGCPSETPAAADCRPAVKAQRLGSGCPTWTIDCLLRLRGEQEQGLAGRQAGRVQLGQRAALYCRVSTADQSCERQERDLGAFAERAGYEVVGTESIQNRGG